jgi:hypothetical protein
VANIKPVTETNFRFMIFFRKCRFKIVKYFLVTFVDFNRDHIKV